MPSQQLRRQNGRNVSRNVANNWALVLAAGEGTRLQQLTTTSSGLAVPKQFCCFGGGNSLLHNALARAHVVARPERTCVIVAEQHRRWWGDLPWTMAGRNIVVQPHNRGTANGILLPLLRILARDPDALLLVLPSDHHVCDERILADGLRHAMRLVKSGADQIVLLGLVPDEPYPELGYIVPGEPSAQGVRHVSQFIEKPNVALAAALMENGALWNSFIFAANGQALLRVFEQHCPQTVRQMRAVIESAGKAHLAHARLTELYGCLPNLDFSRDIVQQDVSRLRAIRVLPCGWSDLGTPRRVAQAVHRRGPAATRELPASEFLDLAVQAARLHGNQRGAGIGL